ncbi:MAG: GGDEF domain-containing protein, partial [Thermoleophilia bacterium]|nr:GGDEF domain-containing protein [Thermoleophilia bacterium]
MQSDVLKREGAADVTAALEEVGLAAKTGWHAGALLYGASGLATLVLYLLASDAIPAGVFVLALVAIVLSVVSMLGARYLSNANWATHLRLSLGLSIFLVGAFVAGPARVAFVLLPLFVLVTPSFVYGARFAIPYTVVVSAVIFAVLVMTPGPARIAHAGVTVGAVWMIVMSFLAAEHTTRRLARVNRTLAYSDPLTEIANMRRLRERLSEALGKPLGNGRPFALFAIDLDNFKLVNDNYDHSTGDCVLRAVAEALTAEADALDLVARRGGDEFSVFVPDPDRRDLDSMARRLAAAIGQARSSTCPQVTSSGSVAYVRSVDGDTITSVLQRADDALHDAKHAFRTEHGHRNDIEARIASMPRVPSAGTPRKASFDRVAAAFNRAYSPRRSTTGSEMQRHIDGLRRWWSELNPLLSFAAAAVPLAGLSLIV